MVDIQSATAEIRRGKKKRKKKKPQGKNIMSASATQGGHKKKSTTAKLLLLHGRRDNQSAHQCPRIHVLGFTDKLLYGKYNGTSRKSQELD